MFVVPAAIFLCSIVTLQITDYRLLTVHVTSGALELVVILLKKVTFLTW